MDMMSYLMGKNSGGGGKGATIEVVTELPATGESNVIYLVPKQDTGDNNVFDEYLYVNDEWELIGTTDIDLSNYYTKNETQQLIDDNGNAKIYKFKITTTPNAGLSSGVTFTSQNVGDLENMSDIITNGYKNGITGIMLGSTQDINYYYLNMSSNITLKENTLYFQDFIFPYKNNISVYHYLDCYLEVNGTWSGDAFNCTKITFTPITANSGKGYITTWRNENAITPTGDYNPATKKYVDDAVAGAGGGINTTLKFKIPQSEMQFAQYPYLGTSYTISNSSWKNAIKDFLQKMYDENQDNFNMIFYGNYSSLRHLYYNFDNNQSGAFLSTKPSAIEMYSFEAFFANNNDYNPIRLYISSIVWDGDTINSFTATMSRYNNVPYLTKNNTDSYTPTFDYSPATKKYVDDKVAAAITTTLGGSY